LNRRDPVFAIEVPIQGMAIEIRFKPFFDGPSQWLTIDKGVAFGVNNARE
jgi:hypothetical protein